MFSFTVAAVAGGLAVGAKTIQNQRRLVTSSGRLVTILVNGKQPNPQQLTKLSEKLTLPRRALFNLLSGAQTEMNACLAEAQVVLTDISDYARAIDNRYQHLIQTQLDPLLISKVRREQIQALTTDGVETISEDEKTINRRLGLGLVGIGLVGITALTGLPLSGVVLGIGLFLALRIYKIAWRRTVNERRLGVSHLLTIYITGMWLGGAYLSGLMGVIFYSFNLKMLAIIETRARQRIIDVFGRQSQVVWLLVDGVEMEVPLAQVQTGDILVVDAGQIIPIDGTIARGNALIDQRMLTGEAQPAEKGVGDPVLAATLVLGGKIFVRVEKTGDATSAAQIGAILNQTAAQRQSMVLKAIEIANQSLMPMLAASALGWLIHGPTAAMAMLGCNFIIDLIALGPLAMLQLLNRTSDRGILIKDGRALEMLTSIDTVVFDKTGTLTLECPHLVRIHTASGHAGYELSADELLALAAAAEQRQSHPLAQAIVGAAHERKLTLPAIEEAHVAIGFGLKVWLTECEDDRAIAGQEQVTQHRRTSQLVRIGSQRFMEMEGIALPVVLQAVQAVCHDQAHTLVFVAIQDEVMGALELQATVRPEAKAAVQALQQRNLELYIISGDNDAPTRTLAAELGITHYFANTLPERKADLVVQLQQAGRKVCFVGDGINDAIALRQADVSISLRGATTAATDTAQIVLMDANLEQLDTILTLAHQFNQRVERMFSNATNFSLFAGASILFLNMNFAAVQLLNGLQFARGVMIAREGREQDDQHIQK